MQPTKKSKLIKIGSSILLVLTLMFVAPVATNAQTRPNTTTTTVDPQPTKAKGLTQAQIKAWAAAYRRHEIRMWKAAIREKQIRDWIWRTNYNKMIAHLKAEKARKSYPRGLCGGDLPPCYVMMRESKGNITAQNPRSTASGKWQFLDSTWAGFGGYAKARYAPERVQDAKARALWNHGRGCSHWRSC